MVRDDKTTPTRHETGFAKWLAKPDMTGGVVIALQQPAKSQVFTADVEWVRDECASLAYLNKCLEFVESTGGMKTTSVFDAFPFIIENIPTGELANEARCAYNTFRSMVDAKKPEVLFACWRIHGHDLFFSGKGPGKTKDIDRLEFANGHVVRVVNGFHPSYVANYCPNESCFRKLFAMELCKAFCELNEAWQEDTWMDDLRRTCRLRTGQLMKEKGTDGEQLNTESGRRLRRSTAVNTASKYKAYTKSFDNGMGSIFKIFSHMVSSNYTSQSTWELYILFVFNHNTSEGICDTLLAVSEAMGQFASETSMREPALVELGRHISQQTLKLVKDDVPDLLVYKRGLYKNLWSNRFLSNNSRGLKRSLEGITVRFIEDLTESFSESATGWTYTPQLVNDAFKELAVSFENALGKEYDEHQQALAASTTTGVANLSASLYALSIASTQSPASATSATNRTPTRPSLTDNCFRCSQRGHWSRECPNPPVKSTTPPTSPSSPRCYKCGKAGHYSNACPSPRKGSATAPTRTNSGDKCFNCNEFGHWSGQCPRRRQGSLTPSRSRSGDKCYSCGDTGHWSSNCPRRTNK
ncbi:hypothetical protein BKA67DRAFT_528432 [Truncatella angustata]|uniref:CCHC-type domain-containing protein n=1 Tax=Truncatella angustata TaxID=152316 RepID=A0A9P8UBJ5_9PEZI|nr:uncharacterized protein BKA67DRAFT_528432 [Truncatella angustata]KAH6640042.1 hypothetical protein BKA67DRAFT_528432 [Truncatella angustata]